MCAVSDEDTIDEYVLRNPELTKIYILVADTKEKLYAIYGANTERWQSFVQSFM